MENLKTCSSCRTSHPLDFFHKKNQAKDGLTSTCKSCCNEYSKKWRENNSERYKARQSKAKREKGINGICRQCKQESIRDSKLCEKHWYENVSTKHFGTSKHGEYLKSLWSNQNQTCIYTGEKLYPTLNMSLDHIVSKHDNPTLSKELSNVQWVTRDINRGKGKLSHNQFILLCKFVSDKFSP